MLSVTRLWQLSGLSCHPQHWQWETGLDALPRVPHPLSVPLKELEVFWLGQCRSSWPSCWQNGLMVPICSCPWAPVD